jgi:hypothetical protein
MNPYQTHETRSPSNPVRPKHHQLQRSNRQRGLDLTDETCVPTIYPGDKLDLDWQVANLAETDSRLTATAPKFER